MAKTLIITGAGASCDWPVQSDHQLIQPAAESPDIKALGNLKFRLSELFNHNSPPLTKDLVQALRTQATGCGQLLQVISAYQRKQLKRFDFEKALRDIVDRHGQKFENELLHLRTAIKERMSLANEIGTNHDTLYTQLYGSIKAADRKNRDGTITINLNYDRLAEFAITNRKGFRDFNGFIENDSGHQLYHPHGHCMWTLGKTDSRTSSLAPERAGSPSESIYWGSTNRIIPCLALPMSGDDKGKTAWPQYHCEALADRLKDVDEILIIGWRGYDSHIVNFIEKNIGNVEHFHIVGGFREYLDSADSMFHQLFPLNIPDA